MPQLREITLASVIPDLRGMYDENDGKPQVFYFKNVLATVYSFAAAPEIVKFSRLSKT